MLLEVVSLVYFVPTVFSKKEWMWLFWEREHVGLDSSRRNEGLLTPTLGPWSGEGWLVIQQTARTWCAI